MLGRLGSMPLSKVDIVECKFTESYLFQRLLPPPRLSVVVEVRR